MSHCERLPCKCKGTGLRNRTTVDFKCRGLNDLFCVCFLSRHACQCSNCKTCACSCQLDNLDFCNQDIFQFTVRHPDSLIPINNHKLSIPIDDHTAVTFGQVQQISEVLKRINCTFEQTDVATPIKDKMSNFQSFQTQSMPNIGTLAL